MAPSSTVLTQSAVAEGDELFSEILSNIRRLYPEVYGPAVSLGGAPKIREFPTGEGGGLSGGTSVTSFSKLGAYAGRFNNLILVRTNNLIPSLTNEYLDTSLVGLTPELLEYVHLPDCLGYPHGYSLTRKGDIPDTSATKPPPPPTTTTTL